MGVLPQAQICFNSVRNCSFDTNDYTRFENNKKVLSNIKEEIFLLVVKDYDKITTQRQFDYNSQFCLV